ncbi:MULTISPECIES: hypothetical protein [Paenibacillus]|uniref:hypothetical protein n=1 Tax=Paenibacillus TaxID=44249 RepID=UPI00203B32B2|nr:MULTISPECIES: hypothetical protein [Paenibacillus]
MVSVKISNIPSNFGGLRSAKVVLSYDENVFTTESNVRFDGDLGFQSLRDYGLSYRKSVSGALYPILQHLP